MPHLTAFPFVLKRSQDVVDFMEITSTTETVHGLVRLDGERLVFQWRLTRATESVGMEIRTDRELEPVREVELPLSALAGATIRWRWLVWPPGHYLVLTAADLRAFDEIAGEAGLRLNHAAELAIRVRRADRLAAADFAAELTMAVAETALRAAESPGAMAPGELPARQVPRRT